MLQMPIFRKANLPHFLIGVVAASLFLIYRDSEKQKLMLCELLFWLASIIVAVTSSKILKKLFQLNYVRHNFSLVLILLGVV